jgi:hypothetical protein
MFRPWKTKDRLFWRSFGMLARLASFPPGRHGRGEKEVKKALKHIDHGWNAIRGKRPGQPIAFSNDT